MTVGIATAQANSLLDTLLGSTFISLHTGDPGAAGTANASTVTTRPAASYSAAAAGSKALSAASSWTNWAGSADTVDLSAWFNPPLRGALVGATVAGVASAAIAGNNLTIPAGVANDAAYLLVFGVHV
jgi:hypothetical protein